MLIVSTRKVNHATVLKCSGRMVLGQQRTLLCAAVRLSEFALDLSEVEAIDAAGIGLLVSLQAAGVYLTLVNPSDAVRNVLRLTGVDTVLPIVQSVEDAFAARSIPAASIESQPPVSVAIAS